MKLVFFYILIKEKKKKQVGRNLWPTLYDSLRPDYLRDDSFQTDYSYYNLLKIFTRTKYNTNAY